MTSEEIVQKVKLGMTRAQVKEVLGPPHDMNIGTRKYWRPMVWKYGKTELHFGHEEDSGLWLVGNFEDPENHETLLK